MPRASILRSFLRPPWPVLFALAGPGVILSAYGSVSATLPAFCSPNTVRLLLASNSSDAFALVLAFNPPDRLLAGWALMLLAMMPPLLAAPLTHVWRSSLSRRRAWSVLQFAIGYAAVWLAVGPLLIALALVLQRLAGDAGGAVVGALLAAVMWSASPWLRAVLNRGHRLERIGLFGWAASWDCVRYGTVHACWCVASCWLWMLVVVAAGDWHFPAMVAAAVIIFVERLAPTGQPRWHWPVPIAALDPRPVFAPVDARIHHG